MAAYIIATIDESLDWLAPFSLLHWATNDSPGAGQYPATYLALLAASLILLAATVLVFDRHELS